MAATGAATADSSAEPVERPAPPAPSGRDLRLDLFRGLALWFIFLNHVPNNVANWITNRNFGFSDATEIFVFISGYTAAMVYGRQLDSSGVMVTSARILRRAWQLYVAFIFLFVIYLAEISYVVGSFENPLYAEEMGALQFLAEPDVALVQALLLKFRPANMDVLPLYIVLLATFPPILWALKRWADATLAASFLLWLAVQVWGFNLTGYPDDRTWFFNPFGWQFMFVFGGWCGLGGSDRLAGLVHSRIILALSVLYLVLSLAVVTSWYWPPMEGFVPEAIGNIIYPISKTDLSVLRFAHFLALAVVVVRLIPVHSPFLYWRLLKPMIICGQHSLEVFCFGVFLSFAAHFVLNEVSGTVFMQLTLSVAGIAFMVGLSALLSWYARAERDRAARKRAG
ncbi:OpgC domain-containing protein [Ancylobacter dichloromethanicus]|uniref:Membrane protein n=1 Tax=Ancylobacter dichloromethanicus TaxID=518825 RepID=A0A9W6MYC9_9HYPH|nr:OpgC domain-containing protein [Ancylobacter dichloromethanicus]MBS7553886.1 OpgC domain-containing protein [Ancylobacter dichloromethanicus]GLK70993.1 membrane protein [Ancylobacter dichloromethanicus]